MLVAIEGITNSGKTTLCKHILDSRKDFSTYQSNNVVHNNVRNITHDVGNLGMFSCKTELFLYMSILSEKTNQFLMSNGNFLLDRFSLSVFSYFRAKYDFESDFLEQLIHFSTSGIIPDLTVFLDVPFDVIISRSQCSPLSRKDLDLPSYYNLIREYYLESILRYSKYYVIIDGTQNDMLIKKNVEKKIQEIL